jgi:hypothetical protein
MFWRTVGNVRSVHPTWPVDKGLEAALWTDGCAELLGTGLRLNKLYSLCEGLGLLLQDWVVHLTVRLVIRGFSWNLTRITRSFALCAWAFGEQMIQTATSSAATAKLCGLGGTGTRAC